MSFDHVLAKSIVISSSRGRMRHSTTSVQVTSVLLCLSILILVKFGRFGSPLLLISSLHREAGQRTRVHHSLS